MITDTTIKGTIRFLEKEIERLKKTQLRLQDLVFQLEVLSEP